MLGCAREPADPIRVGFSAWPGYEYLYLAEQLGSYTAEGVRVRLVEYDSLTDVLRGFERGQIDVIGCTVVELMTARHRAAPDAQAFYVADYSFGGDEILALPGIASVAQLVGKRVGLELGSVGAYVLARALGRNGLSLADVQLISSDPSTMGDALSEGRLDAVVTYPPQSATLRHEHALVSLFTTRELPGEVVDILATNGELLRRRTRDLAALIRGFQRAVDHGEQQSESAFAVMARREGITPAAFRLAHEGLRLVPLDEQLKYLAIDGAFAGVARTVEELLRGAQLIEGSDLSAGSWTSGPVDAALATGAGFAAARGAVQ